MSEWSERMLVWGLRVGAPVIVVAAIYEGRLLGIAGGVLAGFAWLSPKRPFAEPERTIR